MPKFPEHTEHALRLEFEKAMNPWYQIAVDAGRIPEKYRRGAPGLGLFSILCDARRGWLYSDPDVEMQFQAFALGYQRAEKQAQAWIDSQRQRQNAAEFARELIASHPSVMDDLTGAVRLQLARLAGK